MNTVKYTNLQHITIVICCKLVYFTVFIREVLCIICACKVDFMNSIYTKYNTYICRNNIPNTLCHSIEYYILYTI